jgi:hypothetical protein
MKKNKISGQSLESSKGNFNKYEQNEQIFLYLAHLYFLILVVCFDKIYIALSLKEVVQFKYINLCGGGLGEKMRVQFSAQVSSEVIKHNSNIIEKLNTSNFRPKKFREIQVILSEDQLIWFYQTFLLKSRTQISPVVLTNHTEEYEVKIRPKFY